MTTDARSEKLAFGFWVFLLTDLLMFAVLFASYAVLRGATFGGPGAGDLLNLTNALWETLALLTSSLTSSLAMLAIGKKRADHAVAWLAVTFLLGAAFLGLELSEFAHLITTGNGPQRNAFLSSFFTLVGAHGLHITLGLLWMFVGMMQIRIRGLSRFVVSRLQRFSLFWHFLDLVWIFIFTAVYLLGHVR